MNEKTEEEMRIRLRRPADKMVARVPPLIFVVIGLLVFLLICSAFFAWNFYGQAKKNNTPLRTDDKTAIIQNIGKHVLLPVGEEPVFATVTDPAKLTDQPFFLHAQTGDKVLVFPKGKRAILYRPSTDRIIEMMPIDLGATVF